MSVVRGVGLVTVCLGKTKVGVLHSGYLVLSGGQGGSVDVFCGDVNRLLWCRCRRRDGGAAVWEPCG